jgi:AbrB family looped-hinge helix DNA binding protein
MNTYFRDMKSIVGERGQVTIPKALRRSLGLRAGEEVQFEERQGTVVLSRAARSDPWDALVGIAKPMDVDAALVGLRGPALHSRSRDARARVPRRRPGGHPSRKGGRRT